ncbi:MAG: HAMP domain-containing protein [Haloarculaceae archaeon]
MPADPAGGSILARVVPNAIRRRFVAKFVLSVVLVMLLTGALGAYLYGTTTATLTDRTTAQYESTARLQADGIDRWIEGLRHQTRLISQAPAFQTGNQSRIDYYLLRERQRFREDIYAVHFVSTKSWEVLASTRDAAEGANMTGAAPWASERRRKVAMTTNVASNVLVAGRPYESPGSGGRVIAFVSSPPKGTEYIVVVEANLSACDRSFDQPDEAAFTTVRTTGGGLVCGGAANGIGGTNGNGSGGHAVPPGTLSAAGSGVVTTAEALVSHATVDATGWTVLTHVPKSEAYGLRDRIGTSMLALVLVPLVALGLVAVVVGRRASGELTRLTSYAAEMREGNLDVEIDVRRSDEFGALARGFAEMRDALKQQIEEAEQARSEAEVARAEAVRTNEHLREKARSYSETLSACARGDLTRRLEQDSENEAMDRIASDFNEMVRELELTTGQLKRFAEDVSEGGDAVHSSAEAVRDASEQVAESIQKISDDAHETRERLRAVSEEMDAVADALAEAAADDPDRSFEDPLARVRTVGDLVEDAAETSDTVMAESETVAGAAEEQAAELSEVSQRALDLKRTAQYLGDGISHFETEGEHEFVFQTGAAETDSPPDAGD